MGAKYMIYAFTYPFVGYERLKQTRWFIVALIYLIFYKAKYNGVVLKRESWR